MNKDQFSWRNTQFTYADLLTGARLVMLPYLLYGLTAKLTGLAAATLAGMIATDLVDGPIARRLGQARPAGGAFDSTIDFIVIYATFSALWLVGILPWWKWAAIFFPALLMAATQVLHLLWAGDLASAPARVGKLVGQIQFVYLPFLVARIFWWRGEWAALVDHLAFALLAVAIGFNTLDQLRTLRRLLRAGKQAP